jgi:hypothetical protein
MVRDIPFIKNRYNVDFTPTFKSVYLLMIDKYGVNSRISNFIEMFRTSFDIQEWVSYDPRYIQNMNFESYLMDLLKKFIDGDDVNFMRFIMPFLRLEILQVVRFINSRVVT